MEVKIVNNETELYECVEKDTEEVYYLIGQETKTIEDYIADSGLDDDKLINLKLAYNLKFNGYLQDIDTKAKLDVESIEDVLKKLQYNYANTTRLIIDVKKEEQKLLMDIIQQFIFLNIKNFDILTPIELENSQRYTRFNEKKEELLKSVAAFELATYKYATEDKNIITSKEELSANLAKIKESIDSIKDRKLIISVVALRNAGKSVIVNSFLGDEYAPTSEEDSTPNAIYYETWDKEYIEVKIEKDSTLEKYQAETIKTFKTPTEVSEFLTKEFKEANKSDEKYMPNVYIKYKGKLDYIIIDTPGPNKEGEHQNIMNECLEDSDAVIMAIEYGDNEEKQALALLEEVQSTLSKKNKLHSLLVVANKLDRMYENTHSKSVVRYLDKSIRYLKRDKNIPVVMMPASSLEYFYINQYIKILKEKSIEIDTDQIKTLLEKISPRGLNSKEKTVQGFIESQVSNLRRFHFYENITVDDVKVHSNMAEIKSRIEYIAKKKVFEEIFANKFYQIDRDFTDLSNRFLVSKIKDLQDRRDEIIAKLDNVEKFFEDKKKEIESKKDENHLKEEIKKRINAAYNDVSKNTIDFIETHIETSKIEVVNGTKNHISKADVVNDDYTKQTRTFIDTAIERINSEKNEYLTDLELKAQGLDREIQDKIKSQEFEKYNLNISLSELQPSLSQDKFQLDFSGFNDMKIDARVIHYALVDITSEIDEEYKELADGFWNKFKDSAQSIKILKKAISKPKYDVKTKKVDKPDIIKVNKQLENIERILINDFSKFIEDERKNSINNLNKQLEGFDKKIQSDVLLIIHSYEETNKNIKKLLNSDKSEIEEQEKFFHSIQEKHDDIKKVIDIIIG